MQMVSCRYCFHSLFDPLPLRSFTTQHMCCWRCSNLAHLCNRPREKVPVGYVATTKGLQVEHGFCPAALNPTQWARVSDRKKAPNNREAPRPVKRKDRNQADQSFTTTGHALPARSLQQIQFGSSLPICQAWPKRETCAAVVEEI